jgi:hypothetical protein
MESVVVLAEPAPALSPEFPTAGEEGEAAG